MHAVFVYRKKIARMDRRAGKDGRRVRLNPAVCDALKPLISCTIFTLCLFDTHSEQGSRNNHNSRLKKSNKMQLYADIYLLLYYSTCFGRPSRPSSGVHKTAVAACGTDHTMWGASFFKRDVTFEEACSPDSMICTRGCNYSFMYS